MNVCVNVAPFALCKVLLNLPSSVQFAPETTSWLPPAHVQVTVSPTFTLAVEGTNSFDFTTMFVGVDDPPEVPPDDVPPEPDVPPDVPPEPDVPPVPEVHSPSRLPPSCSLPHAGATTGSNPA